MNVFGLHFHRFLHKLGTTLVQKKIFSLILILLLSLLSIFAVFKKTSNGLPVDFSPQAIFIDSGSELNRLRELESIFGTTK